MKHYFAEMTIVALLTNGTFHEEQETYLKTHSAHGILYQSSWLY